VCECVYSSIINLPFWLLEETFCGKIIAETQSIRAFTLF